MLISVYISPFTGGAIGVPRTTEPSGAASGIVCLVLLSMNPYLPGNLPACKFDATVVAAEAVLVVSAAAGSSATSYQMQSHSDLVVHRESLMSLLFYCSKKISRFSRAAASRTMYGL